MPPPMMAMLKVLGWEEVEVVVFGTDDIVAQKVVSTDEGWMFCLCFRCTQSRSI